MWPLSTSVTEAIRQRYSCRAYDGRPIAAEQAVPLATFAASMTAVPLGTPLRIALVASTEEDPRALKGLGTYGLIKNPVAFLVGAVGPRAQEPGGVRLRAGDPCPVRHRPRPGHLLAGRQLHPEQLFPTDCGLRPRDRAGRSIRRLCRRGHPPSRLLPPPGQVRNPPALGRAVL
jgi:hypothetical protein